MKGKNKSILLTIMDCLSDISDMWALIGETYEEDQWKSYLNEEQTGNSLNHVSDFLFNLKICLIMRFNSLKQFYRFFPSIVLLRGLNQH